MLKKIEGEISMKVLSQARRICGYQLRISAGKL